jgi:phage antirepressor YoqD-like protein
VGIFFGETEMEILNLANAEMMTSREIAEIAEASHDNVLKNIRNIAAEGSVFKTTPLERKYIHPQNKQVYTELLLDFRSTMIVVAAYKASVRAKIIDRWQELEAMQNQPAFKVPQTLSEALLLGAELAKKVEEQALQLEAQAPSVAYVENFVKCDGLIGIREAAKSLGLQQNAFVQMLVAAKIMFRENGHLQAYATDIEAKRFAVKVTKDHSGKARSQTMLTAKGIRWVANKLELDKLFAND